MKKVFLCICLAFSCFLALYAQDSITLTVSGVAFSKEEATKQALRGAIEQAYGVFVSSNTSILNDELVKDEIVTISQGNIQNYKELSSSQLSSGAIEVQLQATVSISKLVSYAKSKGASAELSGGTFGMNMKLFELNKKNEKAALENLYALLKDTPPLSLFDYKMDIEGPFADEGRYGGADGYTVRIKVNLFPNDNTQQFFDTFYKTINAIGIKPSEVESLEQMGVQLSNLGDATYNQNSRILLRNCPADNSLPPFISSSLVYWQVSPYSEKYAVYNFDINVLVAEILGHISIADNVSYPKESSLIAERGYDDGYVFNYTEAWEKGCKKLNRRKGYNYDSDYNHGYYLKFKLIIPKSDISKFNQFSIIEK